MVKFRGEQRAFGPPGIEPRWTAGSKDAVGTAYSSPSRIWFTLWRGILTETYFPTVDTPQIRDLQFLISDGKSFLHEEKRHLQPTIECLGQGLGYRTTNRDSEDRYRIVKEIIADPHLPCILQHVQLLGEEDFVSQLRLYALCSPHLKVSGWGNNAYVVSVAGQDLLVCQKGNTWLAMGATVPFCRLSCGYVGTSDGWTDLAANFEMNWQFDQAIDGNVALTGELDLSERREFTLGLAFGHSLNNAATVLLQSLSLPFAEQLQRFIEQWERPYRHILPLAGSAKDGGKLYRNSYGILLAHEDKSNSGALIASLAIPWGEAKGEDDTGGYHLVWPRDMVNSATALLAAGNRDTPLRALIYLAAVQREDGGFSQNFWIGGQTYWQGLQLDEVSFPILLAWRLRRADALQGFDPCAMVLEAAGCLIRKGPATGQERWEEAGGLSPSTLATNIASLICAASFARERQDEASARFLEEYADYLESHLEAWTATNAGTLVPGIRRHYIRIQPVGGAPLSVDLEGKRLGLANQKPGDEAAYPASTIVDAGFLELVRYGIRRADDPLIVDSIKVVDAVLKVETPMGPVWRRYNHDGYGQRDDGGPFTGWGTGRAWPLLTGERGHYELAAGGDVQSYLQALEAFASPAGPLPEQVWDAPDLPQAHLHLGKPTGSAMPLAWAHAEYIKLLRSTHDGEVFDLIPEVRDRYQGERASCHRLEIWKPAWQIAAIKAGDTLRILQDGRAFRVHWSADEWQSVQDTPSVSTALGIAFADLPTSQGGETLRFTFFWIASNQWEGRDYAVQVI